MPDNPVRRALYAEAQRLRHLADALELRAEGTPDAFGPDQVLAVHRVGGRIDGLLPQLPPVEQVESNVIPLIRKHTTERTPS